MSKRLISGMFSSVSDAELITAAMAFNAQEDTESDAGQSGNQSQTGVIKDSDAPAIPNNNSGQR